MNKIIKTKINYVDFENNKYNLGVEYVAKEELAKYELVESATIWSFGDLPNSITEYYEYATEDDSYMKEALTQSQLCVEIITDYNGEIQEATFWIER